MLALAATGTAVSQVQIPRSSPCPIPSVTVRPEGAMVHNLTWSNLLCDGFRFHLAVTGFREWTELLAQGCFDVLPAELSKQRAWPLRRPEPQEALIELVWPQVPQNFDDAMAELCFRGHEWISLELFLALAAIPSLADTFPLAGITSDLWESSPGMFDKNPLPCIATSRASMLRLLALRSRKYIWDPRTRFPAIVSVTSR